MSYSKLLGKVWKTKTTVSNGNIDFGEITLNQIAKFARAERKRSSDKGGSVVTLTPVTKWIIGMAIRNFDEYAELLDGKDIELVEIAIQCV